MNRWLIYGIACLALQAQVLAQTDSANVPPPAAPFVQFPKPNAAFTIEFTASTGEAIKAPALAPTPSGMRPLPHEKQVVKVDAIQVGALRGDTLTWDDGSHTQTWYVGRYGLVQSPRGNWVNIVDPVMYPIQRNAMLRRDASDYLSWLNLSNYVGVKNYKGRPCYEFKVGSGPAPTDENDINMITGPDEKVAWIDVTNKLPVALQIKGQLLTYTFRDPPTEPLILPPMFKAEADRFGLLNSPPPANSH